jgi:hypothetical protein
MSAFWNRSTTTTSQFSHLRSGSRRLDSSMSNYSESGVAVTRPPYQEGRTFGTLDQVEMLDVPKSHRHTNASFRSCSSDEGNITALPQIGCIPEGSYSNTSLTRGHPAPTPQWSGHEKDMV